MSNSTAPEKVKLSDASRDEKRQHRCCITGHRPQGITRPLDDIKADLENAILDSLHEGYSTFITGMCYGVDIWAGEIVAKVRVQHPEVKLIAAIPYPGFPEQWEQRWQGRYKELLAHADLVKTISPRYDEEVFDRRNRWMCDHSAKVIAVSTGQKSGTEKTIAYARSQQMTVKFICA